MTRWVLLAALAACGSREQPTPPPPAGARVGAALAAALTAADAVRAPWRCALPAGAGLATATLTTGARSWHLAGHMVAIAPGPDPKRAGSGGDGFAIGVIADAGGAAPTTLAALARLRTALAAVDLVIVLGGMGTTPAELEAVLGVVSDGNTWPVVALPGDLEGASSQTAAIAALRARDLPVIDGRLVRRIEIPGATIGTVSGAGSATRLVAGGDGCSYRVADATAVLADLDDRAGLRVLAVAEAPRITTAGEAAGELGLTPLPGTIDVVLHAPRGPAATAPRTGTRDGTAVALSPGSSDATTRSPAGRPSAGILAIAGTTWKWRTVTAE